MEVDYTFPLVGEPLAVDLVNTLAAHKGLQVDLLPNIGQARAWWRLHEEALHVAAPESESIVEALRELRGAVSSLFSAAVTGTPPPLVAIDVLNTTSAKGALFPRLVVEDDRFVVQRAPQSSALATGLAAIARSAMEVVADNERGQLTVCQGPHCGLLFVATNSRRRWCSPTRCGNRVRAARHYRRRSGVEAPDNNA